MPLRGEAHEISFKNILKYISFPLQFFIHCFLLISATVPLTRAFKLYWFPCYKIKLFLVSACCPFNQSPQTIFNFILHAVLQPNYVHVYTISTLDLRSIQFLICTILSIIPLYTQCWMEVHIYIYSCTITTKMCHKKIILLRCFL